MNYNNESDKVQFHRAVLDESLPRIWYRNTVSNIGEVDKVEEITDKVRESINSILYGVSASLAGMVFGYYALTLLYNLVGV